MSVEIGGKTVTVGGMCKGSGMIHPNMCTMLSFVTTDADISKEMLQEALSTVVKDTYNMVSVDGTPPPTTRCCCWPTAWRAILLLTGRTATTRFSSRHCMRSIQRWRRKSPGTEKEPQRCLK